MQSLARWSHRPDAADAADGGSKLGVVCPYEPRENVLAGTRYLRDLYLEFGRWPEAIAAYNAGPVRVSSGRIPAETRVYVRRVIASWRPQLLAHITF